MSEQECDVKYVIRPEQQADYDVIYQLIKTAFETAEVKDGTEQDFAVSLRQGQNYIPDLALVVGQNEQLIAHIMLTRLTVQLDDVSREPINALMLAPVAVLKEYRNKDIGSKLILESLKRAKQMGYQAVFLCGDPLYYARFGFKKSTLYGIKNTDDIPEEYVLAYELEKDVLNMGLAYFSFF